MHCDSLCLRLIQDHRPALLGYIRSFSPYSRTRREEQGQFNPPSTCSTRATRSDTSISTLVIGVLVFWSHRVHRVVVKASILSTGRSSFFPSEERKQSFVITLSLSLIYGQQSHSPAPLRTPLRLGLRQESLGRCRGQCEVTSTLHSPRRDTLYLLAVCRFVDMCG